MALGRICSRPLVWGGMAAGILALDAFGLLDDIAAQAGLMAAQDGPSHVQIDSQIAASQDLARSHLPRYLAQAVQQPDQWDTWAVKVQLNQDGATEDVWVEAFEMTEGEAFTGVLTNDAVIDPDLTAGSEMRFDMDQIVDWAFVKNGVGYGYFTVHASLPFMSAAQATVTQNFLAETPLPQGW